MTRARDIADLPGSGGMFQSGTIAYFAMDTAPTGWLECDGSDVSRATYANLFDAIGTEFGVGDGSTTFGLPDLRGEFIRGWDNGRDVDSGRVFGSAQGDAFQGHYHRRNLTGTTEIIAVSGTGWLDPGAGTTRVLESLVDTGNPVADATNGTPRTAAETRPCNVALLACIKT